MRLQHLLHLMGSDAVGRGCGELGRHQGGNSRGPIDPRIALLARQPEHQRGRLGSIDDFIAAFLQLQPRQMCLGDLVRGSCLDKRDAAARRQALFLQGVAHRTSRLDFWSHGRSISGHGRPGIVALDLFCLVIIIGGRGVDHSVQHLPDQTKRIDLIVMLAGRE